MLPELPEVETIVRYLKPKIRGKRILRLWSNTPRLFRQGKNFNEINRLLKGRAILNTARIGKNIVLILNSQFNLYIHLMMTGKLLWNYPRLNEKHIRFFMELGGPPRMGEARSTKLSGKNTLALHDIRKFGWIRLIKKEGAADTSAATNKDALSISFEDFKNAIRLRETNIKNALLNQKIVQGIGNIYSDEILWYAGIKPTRPTNTLDKVEIKKIYPYIKNVLKIAIKKGGTSMRDYRKPDGKEGRYYPIRKVYQREGEKCGRDGTMIKRIKIGGRSAHFCPKHQK